MVHTGSSPCETNKSMQQLECLAWRYSHQQKSWADELPAEPPVEAWLEAHHPLNVLAEAVHSLEQAHIFTAKCERVNELEGLSWSAGDQTSVSALYGLTEIDEKKFSLFFLSCLFGHDITGMFWICCSASVAWDQSDISFFSPVIWGSLPWGCEDCTKIEEAGWTRQVSPLTGSLLTSVQLTGFAFLLEEDLSGDNTTEKRSEQSFKCTKAVSVWSLREGYRLDSKDLSASYHPCV